MGAVGETNLHALRRPESPSECHIMIARSSETMGVLLRHEQDDLPVVHARLVISNRFPVDAADLAIERGPTEAK